MLKTNFKITDIVYHPFHKELGEIFDIQSERFPIILVKTSGGMREWNANMIVFYYLQMNYRINYKGTSYNCSTIDIESPHLRNGEIEILR